MERILRDDSTLRDALYTDLSRCWREYPGAETARRVYPTWVMENREIGGGDRFGSSIVNGAVCDYSILRTNRMTTRTGTSLCRRGCEVEETLEHVIFDCPCYSEQRAMITDVCFRANIQFSVRNVLVHPDVLPFTRKLFRAIVD